MVERLPVKKKVVGPNPTGGALRQAQDFAFRAFNLENYINLTDSCIDLHRYVKICID